MAVLCARCLVLSALAFLCGCGGSTAFPKTYPVTGTVKVNGKPIEGAIVTFQLEAAKENAIGTTDAKGEFILSMFRPSDGAIPGQYNVAISKPDAAAVVADTPPPGQIASGELPADYAPPIEGARPAGGAKKSEIPAKYSNSQTSALRATVSDSAANHFDFDLK